MYLAYSVLGCYTHLCNTVEYCNKFSIHPTLLINFFVNIFYLFIIIPKMKILESPLALGTVWSMWQLQTQCYFQFMDGVEVPQWQLMFVGRLKMVLHSINPSTPLLNVSGLANYVFILVGPGKACGFGTA